MSETETMPRLGQFVRILQGRDNGQYSVIIGIEDERIVLLADGDKRKYDRPKKKNVNHLELIDYVSPEVQSSIQETGRVTNSKLRYVMTRFLSEHSEVFVNEQVTDLKKGEQLDGER